MEEKPLSYLIDSLLPDYIKSDYPLYVSFITKYLEIIEQDTGPFEVLNEITKFIDVDITPEDTLTDFRYQYLNSFPNEFLENVNIREFITNSKNFYSTKGNEGSVRFIFNLINGSIDFYYPSLEIFETNISKLSGDVIGSGNATHKLHDNYFYAYYVYEIESDLDYSVYEDILRNMTHPIGEKLFFKKLVFVDTDGQIFDAQVVYQNYLFWFQNILEIGDLTPDNNYNLITGYKTIAYPLAYSTIIEDHFNPGQVGNNLAAYFTFSPFSLTQVLLEPVEINFAVQNDNISFSGSTITGTGLDVFTASTDITITGSTSNNSTFTISSTDPTSTAIVITGSFTTESAGATITISEDDK